VGTGFPKKIMLEQKHRARCRFNQNASRSRLTEQFRPRRCPEGLDPDQSEAGKESILKGPDGANLTAGPKPVKITQDRLRYYNVSYWLDPGISLSRRQIHHLLEIAKRKPVSFELI
jgi:hypothetical protein